LNTTKRLIRKIPKSKVIVSESGIQTRKDMQFLKKTGVKAVLIGESIVRSANMGKKIRELLGRK